LEWSKRARSFQFLVEWQTSQPMGEPSGPGSFMPWRTGLVWILVTSFAIQILPVIEHNRLGFGVGMFRLLVAVGAGNGNMAPG